LTDGDEHFLSGTSPVLVDSNSGDSHANDYRKYASTIGLSSDNNGNGVDDALESPWASTEFYVFDLTALSALDSDGDGLSDAVEYQIGNIAIISPYSGDTDGDGISDFNEVNGGNWPIAGDLDRDGIPDATERALVSDGHPYPPSDTLKDTDGDTLNDGFEYYYLGTYPGKMDTDGDTLCDDVELVQGLNPWKWDSEEDGLADNLELLYQSDPYGEDSDGDGIGDGYEVIVYHTSPMNVDSDGDYLTDFEEADSNEYYFFGVGSSGVSTLSPLNPDSDNDGVPDYREVSFTDTDGGGIPDLIEYYSGLNPHQSADETGDLDADGLTNLEEYEAGTRIDGTFKNFYDWDNDGMTNAWEATHDLDPNDPLDAWDDPDGDFLFNVEEFQARTDPDDLLTTGAELVQIEFQHPVTLVVSSRAAASDFEAAMRVRLPAMLTRGGGSQAAREYDDDWDGDGLSNLAETTATPSTDPRLPLDQDNDGLPDRWEVLWGMDPQDPDEDEDGHDDGEADTDGDGLDNRQEMLLGTNPGNADTDGDGLQDIGEASNGLDPNNQDSNGNNTLDGIDDFDGDGLSNSDELNTHHTNPLAADEDDDGIDDGVEVTDGTSATSWDTDGDGYSDTEEKHRGTNANSAASAPALENVDSNSEVRYEYWGGAAEIQAEQSSMTGTFYGTHPDSPFEYRDSFVETGSEAHDAHFEIARQAALAKVSHRFYGPDVSAAEETYGIGYAYLGSTTYRSSTIIFSHKAIRVIATTAVPYERVFRLSLQQYIGSVFGPPLSSYSDVGSVAFRIAANKKMATVELPPGAGSFLATRHNTLLIKPEVQPTPPANAPVIREYILARTVGIQPDADMSGVVGGTVSSVNTGSVIQHFVTPKKSTALNQDYVELIASVGSPAFGTVYEWEGDGTAGTGADANKYKVSRTATGRKKVKIKDKETGAVMSEMYVWVVWAPLTATSRGYAVLHDVVRPNGSIGTQSGCGWDFEATIEPASIVVSTAEIPNLKGAPTTSTPEMSIGNHALDAGPYLMPLSKWDIAQRWRAKTIAPNLAAVDCDIEPTSIIAADYPTLAAGKIHQTTPVANSGSDHFPSNVLEGNDTAVKEQKPYTGTTDPDATLLKLTHKDDPRHFVRTTAGSVNKLAEVRYQYGTFARLEISGKWYVISNRFD